MEILHSSVIWILAVVLVAGIFAGYTAGLFGIGGGVVMVPALMTLLPFWHTSNHVVMHVAVGTSLALIVPGAIAASRKQYHLGNLELPVLKTWAPMVCVGVFAGAVIFNFIPTKGLKIIFALYLVGATLYAALQKPPPPGHAGIPGVWWQRVVGFFVGGASLLLGIGGGTFTVPFFKFCHYPLKRAIALSSATSLFIGLLGALATVIDGWGHPGRPPYSLGYVNIPALLAGTPTVIWFAPKGAKRAHDFSETTLKRIYVGFLGLMALYMLIKIF